MKRTLIITSAILLTTIISLFIINLTTMKNLKTEITINASAATVWNILMDHQSYSDWNPFIKSISGETSVGNTLEVFIEPPNQKGMTFKPEVLANSTQTEFRWVGRLFVKGLADGEHYFQLEKIDDNTTKLMHGENFSGLLAGLLMKMMREDTLKGFNAMNEALKVQAEKA